ncbi:MAG TPA: histidine kinase [Clostridiaceae bacterium]|nr:histidine kinase [Clostridiaceae bacterium]
MESNSNKLISAIRKISVKKRLIYSFYLISILPLFIVAILFYRISANSIKDKISESTQQSLLMAKVNINSTIERLESNSIEISFNPLTQKVLSGYKELTDFELFTLEQQLQRDTAQHLTLAYYVTNVLILTKDLDIINAFGGRNRPIDLDKEYLENLVRKIHKAGGKSVFTVVNRDKNNPASKGILMSRYINNIETGERIGYILICVDETYIQGICKAATIGQSSYTIILDNNNTIITSKSPEYPSGSIFKDKKLQDNLFLGVYEDVSFNYVINGAKYLFSYREILYDQWQIISAIPYSYLNNETNMLSVAIIITILFCMLGVVFLTDIISQSIDEPLKTTLALIDRVNNGNLTVSDPDYSQDEIAIVNASFNNMIKKLKISLEKIKATEKQKLNLEFKALMAQINPHFLANTLNSVKWMAQMQNADNIENLVTALISILQDTMGKVEYSTLAGEINSLRAYITIQEYRYLDKFVVSYDIAPESKEFLVPKFILQPIVENAIIHGVSHKKGQGHIMIKSYISNGELFIKVIDNGIGVAADQLENILTAAPERKLKFTNIGLHNVNERIKLKFGEQYGINIMSELNAGTTVTINLPIIHKWCDENV